MKNLGTKDRLARVVVATPLLMCGMIAPLSLAARMGLMAAPGIYMLGSALFGSCLGYRLMGKSTCARPRGAA